MIGQPIAPSDASQGEQNYLASISDVMAALIFVFIIMLALFAYQLSNVTEEQATVTERLKSNGETREHILNEIAFRLEESGISVEVFIDQGVLRLSDNAINFPSGSEKPVSEHQKNVGRLASALAEIVPCYVSSHRQFSVAVSHRDSIEISSYDLPSYCHKITASSPYQCQEQKYPWLLETLLIEGHTDDVPVSRDRRFLDNLELSSMRAATIYRMVTACAPMIEKMRNSHKFPVLSTSGYGFSRPATNDPKLSDYNRRIDLRLLLEPPQDPNSLTESYIQEKTLERIGIRTNE
ncbi:MAG: hypothetical protein OXE59_04395 [Bacteroidetes bacterium]|nr:hypothetical protein [Bacteroidota bacterium]